MVDSLPEQTKHEFFGGRVRVVVGDITRQALDAVVNAANSTLLGGSGVDGAIHRVGGATILEECREIRRTLYPEGLPTGEAVVTGGGKLPARYVIHTVGPIWGREHGREAELLAACYRNVLAAAIEREISTIAFPSISTGAYGYPLSLAAGVASGAIADFLARDDSLREVRLVFFSTNDSEEFLKNHKFGK